MILAASAFLKSDIYVLRSVGPPCPTDSSVLTFLDQEIVPGRELSSFRNCLSFLPLRDHSLYYLLTTAWKELSCISSSFTVIYARKQRRQWQPTPVLLPGKSRGWKSLVGCSPWGHYKLDTTERLHFHFSVSCIGEGNGNPLQCSCLESPRDGGSWWAAIYGVAQSWTWLKRLSSSSMLEKFI